MKKKRKEKIETNDIEQNVKVDLYFCLLSKKKAFFFQKEKS